MNSKAWGIPALVVAVAAMGTLYLVSQDRAVKVDDKGVPVQAAPAPKWEMPGYRQPVSPPPLPPGATFRSLDKINAAAARVGCATLKPDDPAGRLIDVAECLGEKAVSGSRR